MTLIVEARQALGAFKLNAAFTADKGVTALFGRSGSGKTSMIRIISGLAHPQQGKVVLDGDTLLETERKISVPVHRRRFGYVFQEPRLFPHLSVKHNLVYGRWFSGLSPRHGEFDRVVQMLGIGPLLNRETKALSGGERQRVAIGRALLSSPRLLLMDEPLSALDEERKAEILPYLERLRDEAGVPIVYVSHSVAEVTRLADRVVLMDEGRVAAVGSPSEVLKGRALTTSERREAGSILAGTVEMVDPQHGLSTVRLSETSIIVPDHGLEPGTAVRLRVLERDVMIATVRPEGLSALNILATEIVALEDEEAGSVRVQLSSGRDRIFSRITSLSRDRLKLEIGQRVYAVIKSVAVEH